MKRLTNSQTEEIAKSLFKKHLTETKTEFPGSQRIFLGMGKEAHFHIFMVLVSGWERGDSVTLARIEVNQYSGEGAVELFPENFPEESWPPTSPAGLEGVKGYWRGIS